MTQQPQKSVHTILAVDDDRMQLTFLTALLKALGYNSISAAGGKEALETIEKKYNEIDAILLDRFMPDVDGLDVIKRLKATPKWKKIPVIMQTGADNAAQIREGIEAGVFYYLTKPLDKEILAATLASAVRESNQQHGLDAELKMHRASFGFIDQASFTIKTLEDAERLSSFLAYCYPEIEKARKGIAILLINAIEHGNLGIGFETKGQLIKSNTWREEVEKRQRAPEHRDKRIHIKFRKSAKELILQISDEGEGFDWKDYLRIDPARATASHGRGISIAYAGCFSKLAYNEKGNQVTATVLKEDDLEW